MTNITTNTNRSEGLIRFVGLILLITASLVLHVLIASPIAAQAGMSLSQEDLNMADAAIAENTLTLTLPGLGTSSDGPGPLTDADRIILLAIKFHEQKKALVPFSEFKTCLEAAESRPRYREVGEQFWAWYREAAEKGQAGQLGDFKGKFSTYIAMKNTAKRKAANRVLAAQVQSEMAWRKAIESDTKFREKISSRADQVAEARAAYLKEWNIRNESEATAAQIEWESAMSGFPWRSN